MNIRTKAPAILALACVLFAGACSRQSDSAAPNPPMLIEPNISVGKVRVGMSVQQLVAELGEPPRRTANSLEYPKLGFAVMPGPDGIVQVVMCGDVTGLNGPFTKVFSGRTKEGIGMNSSKEDLLKAFGEPTKSERMQGGLESLQYAETGMTFTLEAGKVHHIIVRLRGHQEAEPAIGVDTSPLPGNQ